MKNSVRVTDSLPKKTGVPNTLNRYLDPDGIIVLVAVKLVYFLFHAGRLDSENTGLAILLILALATYVEAFIWVVLMVLLVAAVAVYFMVRKKSAP